MRTGQDKTFAFAIATPVLNMTQFRGILFWVKPMVNGRKMHFNCPFDKHNISVNIVSVYEGFHGFDRDTVIFFNIQ